MNVLKPEIVELINTVEEKYGKKLDTTNDLLRSIVLRRSSEVADLDLTI